MALLRHGKIADGLPLLVEERSCSGHRPMTGFDPQRSLANKFAVLHKALLIQ
jgi:hypothetical protein